MLKNIRVGSSVYILHKNEPRLEVAEVKRIEPLPPQFTMNYQGGVPYQQQRNFVNIFTRIGNDEVNLTNVEADSEVCDYNGMVISESREAMLSEVYALQGASKNVLESLDKHQSIVERCNEIVAQLSPELKREAERDREMECLREHITNLGDDVNEMKSMLTRILKTSKKE